MNYVGYPYIYAAIFDMSDHPLSGEIPNIGSAVSMGVDGQKFSIRTKVQPADFRSNIDSKNFSSHVAKTERRSHTYQRRK
jgi:hypothetical protein